MWQFYIARGISNTVGLCKYGLVRSLLSKCVQPQETGKIFGALAIVCAVMMPIANPIHRQLYNWTLPFFPAAFMFLTAFTLCTSALLNFYLYTQRHRMLPIPKSIMLDENICGSSHI